MQIHFMLENLTKNFSRSFGRLTQIYTTPLNVSQSVFIAVRQEVRNTDNSVVVYELESAI